MAPGWGDRKGKGALKRREEETIVTPPTKKLAGSSWESSSLQEGSVQEKIIWVGQRVHVQVKKKQKIGGGRRKSCRNFVGLPKVDRDSSNCP